ncbi:MAG TPA: ParB/RepB/Spo0J family partition protein, partial [Pseudonocardia sp.]|nr:ParB/RepB/Spo0J family partition protein [Pseudonocardia sp.]
MAERKGGLGRGLAALIPTGPPPSDLPARGPGATAAPVAASGSGAAAVVTAPVLRSVSDGSASDDPADSPEAVQGAFYREIEVSAVRPNPKQPRTSFDEEALVELEHSIREFGLLQPIVVRELDGGTFELVMGERRWRAAQRVGLQRLPAIVRSTGDDAMLRDALLENIHRVQLNPLEEAAAYQQLLEEFGA